jgi:hypothetical protein
MAESNDLSELIRAYDGRLADLSAQLDGRKSEVLRGEVARAKNLTVIGFAAIYDVLSAVLLMSRDVSRQGERMFTEFSETHSDVMRVLSEDFKNDGFDRTCRAFYARLGSLNVDAAKLNHKMNGLRFDLVNAIGDSWLSVFSELLISADRGVFAAKVDLIRKQALTSFPVVGDVVEALFFVQDLVFLSVRRAESSDDYLISIESYCDAIYGYVYGVFNFCAHVENACSGLDPPEHDAIMGRIVRHFQAVADGTHPALMSIQA